LGSGCRFSRHPLRQLEGLPRLSRALLRPAHLVGQVRSCAVDSLEGFKQAVLATLEGL
jgi:hypothetical protein